MGSRKFECLFLAPFRLYAQGIWAVLITGYSCSATITVPIGACDFPLPPRVLWLAHPSRVIMFNTILFPFQEWPDIAGVNQEGFGQFAVRRQRGNLSVGISVRCIVYSRRRIGAAGCRRMGSVVPACHSQADRHECSRQTSSRQSRRIAP